MTHRLLVLGTLGEFVQLIQKAKARAIYTIVCDGYPDGPARQYADEDYVIPVTDIDKVASLCKEKKVDGIITSFSDLLLECMVKIADKAKLPCYLKPEQLPWYRDKSETKKLLEELNLPTPGFKRIPVTLFSEAENDVLLQNCLKTLSFPLVTKPLDKYGSRGIYVVHNLEELKAAALQTAEFTDLDEILVEEYNTGYEFNMMTWVLNGNVQVISIADREKTSIGENDIPISTRNVYPSRLYHQVYQPAKDLLQKFISKTGQTDGALSMQFFWKPGEGIQDSSALENMMFAQQADSPLRHGAVLYFHGREMEISDQSAAYTLSGHPAVVKPWIFYQEGERVIEHGPNPYVALYYIAAENRMQLDQITEEFFHDMTITDTNGNEVLYQNQIPHYPEK